MEDSIVFDILFSLFASVMEITFDTSSFLFVIIQIFRIDSIWTIETTISFSNSNQNSSIFGEKFRCPVSHITKTLNNKFLSSESLLETEFS